MKRYEESQFEGILAVPGAAQILHALQSRPWAIVTSARRTLAEARVVAAGLPLPALIISVDEVFNSKPHPEGFLHPAERLGIAPKDCLVFEDTRPGIWSRSKCGDASCGSANDGSCTLSETSLAD